MAWQNPYHAPRYWKHEQPGKLSNAVHRFMAAEVGAGPDLDESDVAVLRQYLEQWIRAPWFLGVDGLRHRIGAVSTHEQLAEWVNDAHDAGCDPF